MSTLISASKAVSSPSRRSYCFSRMAGPSCLRRLLEGIGAFQRGRRTARRLARFPGFVPVLASELTPRGIRVDALRPGSIDTPALGKLGLQAEAIAAGREGVPKRIPLGRFGTPEEMAEVVAFLPSPAGRYITGTTIEVDGGMSFTASVINLI
jgi:enoyl-ACP reductase-like protein